MTETTTLQERNKNDALAYLRSAGPVGLDRNELAERTRPGQVNAVQSTGAALTTLHAEGRIARLADRVDGRYVYVLPEFVNGRETEEYRRKNVPVGDLEALMAKYGSSVPSYDLRALVEANPYEAR